MLQNDLTGVTVSGSYGRLVQVVDNLYYDGFGNPLNIGGGTGSGAQGPQGPQGVTGLTGPQGANGSNGSNGAIGATGSTGPQGANGAIGSTGPQGANGATGSTGPQGDNGATGSTGPQGDNGATGSIGPQGATGSTGLRGANGATGSVGPQGATGSQGVQGDQGVRGATGPQGDRGFQGNIGIGYAGGFTIPYSVQYAKSGYSANSISLNSADWTSVTAIWLNGTDQWGNDLEVSNTLYTAIYNAISTSSPSLTQDIFFKIWDPTIPSIYSLYSVTISDIQLDPGIGIFFQNPTYIGGMILPGKTNQILISFLLNAGDEGYQGPEGVQGSIGSTGSTIILPIPNVKLSTSILNGLSLVDIFGASAGNFDLYTAPIVIANDLSNDLINTGNVYVEMIIYKRRYSKRATDPNTGLKYTKPKKSGYVVPSPYVLDNFGNFQWNVGWPINFWTRTGLHTMKNVSVSVSRPNHYKVTSANETIPVYEYLNGRFITENVYYRDITGTEQTLSCVVPISCRKVVGANKPTTRFAYSPYFTPMYIAFRYVYYEPSANDNKGQIISGPLSRTIKISARRFPFPPDYYNSGLIGLPVTTPSTLYVPTELKCWIENNLP